METQDNKMTAKETESITFKYIQIHTNQLNNMLLLSVGIQP